MIRSSGLHYSIALYHGMVGSMSTDATLDIAVCCYVVAGVIGMVDLGTVVSNDHDVS